MTKDLPIKIAALIVAFLLWLGITMLGTQTLTVTNVPVSVVNLSPDLGLGAELPEVTVRLRVPRSVQVGDDPRHLVRAIVDLEGSGIGERSVPVNVVSTNPAINVLSVVPLSIRVAIDPVVERDIPVQVIPEGSPADGYQIGDISVSPEQVRLRGALGLFQEISSVDAIISVEGATSDIEGIAILSLPNGMQAIPDNVSARVAIEQSESIKTVGIEVRTTGSPATGYFIRTIHTEPQVIQIRGAKEVLDAIETIRTVPLDVEDISESFEQEVDLQLPDDVSRVNGDSRVRLQVEVAVLEGTKEVRAGVSTADIEDDLRVASITPDSFRVTLRGETEALDRIQEEDVRLVISLSGKGEGSIRIRPQENDIRVPDGIQVVSIEDQEIVVTLESSS